MLWMLIRLGRISGFLVAYGFLLTAQMKLNGRSFCRNSFVYLYNFFLLKLADTSGNTENAVS